MNSQGGASPNQQIPHPVLTGYTTSKIQLCITDTYGGSQPIHFLGCGHLIVVPFTNYQALYPSQSIQPALALTRAIIQKFIGYSTQQTDQSILPLLRTQFLDY